MENPFVQVTASAEVGDPVLLVSNGSHPPAQYALVTTNMILDTADLNGERLLAANDLKRHVIGYLTKIYDNVIDHEVENLKIFPDHCDTDYETDDGTAERAVRAIHDFAKGTPWQDLINGSEWSASAWLTIQSHLETAIHVERLLFCDKNPTNKAAAAYKARFHRDNI